MRNSLVCAFASKETQVELRGGRSLGPSVDPGFVPYTWLCTTSPQELGKNSFLSHIPGMYSQNIYGVQLAVYFYKLQVILMGLPLLYIGELDFPLVEEAD